MKVICTQIHVHFLNNLDFLFNLIEFSVEPASCYQ